LPLRKKIHPNPPLFHYFNGFSMDFDNIWIFVAEISRHQPKWDVTGSRGLIVRSGCDLDSEKLGRLGHGAVFLELEPWPAVQKD
jgi:hypothetical protein